MDRSLFLLPLDQITWSDVQAFLSQHLEETSVLDYTEIRERSHERDLDGLLEIIAAMANSDGGIILAGVSKDQTASNRPGEPVGMHPKFVDSLKNKCRSLMQPSFVPDIVSISMPDKKEVILLVRLSPEHHPRPVLLKDKGVLVRIGDSNLRADYYRLQQLFAEVSRGSDLLAMRQNFSPDSFLRLEEEYDLMIRCALSALGSTSQSLDSVSKKQIRDAVKNTPVDQWILRYAQQASWDLAQPMSSAWLTVVSTPSPSPSVHPGMAADSLAIQSRLYLSVPAFQQGSASAILLDIWLKQLPAQENVRSWYPLDLGMFYETLMAGLATITDPGLMNKMPEGYVIWSPSLFVHIAAKNTPWLDLRSQNCTGLQRTSDGFQAEAEFSESERIAKLDAITKDRLNTLLANWGCVDHEDRIRAMQPPNYLKA